jgi:hypothetical protein
MARLRRVVDPGPGDQATEQLVWARYIARVTDIAGRESRSDIDYMALSADALRELVDRDPDHLGAQQILKHLRLAEEAAR